MKRMMWVLIVLLWTLPAMAQDADAAYQEALRRIEEARVSGTTELDLSSLGLTDLPPEIGQLVSLQSLNLNGNQLSGLPPEIGQLIQLQTLIVNDNQLSRLPPEIGYLAHLQWLGLAYNQLISLPSEIGQLVNLQQLYLYDNLLSRLPPEIGQLINLQVLELAGNAIIFPPPEITSQGVAVALAYLRDYEAMQMRQTIAIIAAGVGGIAGLILAFRWRQRRGLSEKKKRL